MPRDMDVFSHVLRRIRTSDAPTAMSSRPPSVRDLYIDPSSAWSFLPPPSPTNPPDIIPPSYQWSNRPPHNFIFDLSPSLNLDGPSTVNLPLLLKSLIASAFLQYSSTAIAMPWEVAKLLLQVQWVPRDAGEPEEPEIVREDDDVVRLRAHTRSHLPNNPCYS